MSQPSAIDPAKIHARCKARESAEALAELVVAEYSALDSDPAEAFSAWIAGRLIQAGVIAAPPPAEPAVEPFTDEQSRWFGNRPMPYGKHAGSCIDQVPLDYLIWMAEQPDDFKDNLRRYIKSQRIQQEQE